VRESEMKVTLNATETGELIRNTSPRFFIKPVKKAALNVQGSF
jgi:hypothetical protein